MPIDFYAWTSRRDFAAGDFDGGAWPAGGAAITLARDSSLGTWTS